MRYLCLIWLMPGWIGGSCASREGGRQRDQRDTDDMIRLSASCRDVIVERL